MLDRMPSLIKVQTDIFPMIIQEVFHVYLNKFENAVTHLFLVILGNT